MPAKRSTVCPCYNGPRYNGNLVIPDALTSQSNLAITDKLKFWWSRYNRNLVLHVHYSKGRLYCLSSIYYAPGRSKALGSQQQYFMDNIRSTALVNRSILKEIKTYLTSPTGQSSTAIALMKELLPAIGFALHERAKLQS